jgi:hypothetical protein
MTIQYARGTVGTNDFCIETEENYYTFPLIQRQNSHLSMFEIRLVYEHTKTYAFITESPVSTYQYGVKITSESGMSKLKEVVSAEDTTSIKYIEQEYFNLFNTH